MKFEDIAVIGMSGLFPLADNINSYRDLLKDGRDAVRKITDSKARLYGYDKDIMEKEYAFIENEDCFDCGFYGITEDEAMKMTAVERRLLDLCTEAVENSGYSLPLPGDKKSGLVLSISEDDLTDRDDLLSVKSSMITGRIASVLGAVHKAYAVDTACTSAFTAVHQACVELIAEECDFVIAGAFHLAVFRKMNEGYFSTEELTGIASTDFRSHPFENRACGTGIGEGGGVLVLKTLKNALKDRDDVKAVICGSSVSNSRNRGANLMIPDESSMTENIAETIRRAGINASKIEGVEAHGTGTKIGDAIELQSYARALGEGNNCFISSVKSNIGHLENASGIAALIKMIIEVSEGVHFPLCGFREKTDAVSWEKTRIRPCCTLQKWESSKRYGIAGGYAMNGNCVHMVIRNHTEEQRKAEYDTDCIIKITAGSRSGLNELIGLYRKAVSEIGDERLADFAFSVNTCRAYDKYTATVSGKSCRDIVKALDELNDDSVYEMDSEPLVVLLCSGTEKKEYDFSADNYADEKFRLIELLERTGIRVSSVLGCGAGNIVVKHWRDPDIDNELIKNEISVLKGGSECNEEKFRQFIRKQCAKQKVIYITYEEGILDRILEQDGVKDVVRISGTVFPEELAADLCKKGVHVNWKVYYQNSCQDVKRISIPFIKRQNKKLRRKIQ